MLWDSLLLCTAVKRIDRHVGAHLQIVELLNIVYCLAELTEFAAFIHLRRVAPHLRRPFKIPLPTWGCVLMLTPATVLLLALIAQPLLDMDWLVSLNPFSRPPSFTTVWSLYGILLAWPNRPLNWRCRSEAVSDADACHGAAAGADCPAATGHGLAGMSFLTQNSLQNHPGTNLPLAALRHCQCRAAQLYEFRKCGADCDAAAEQSGWYCGVRTP